LKLRDLSNTLLKPHVPSSAGRGKTNNSSTQAEQPNGDIELQSDDEDNTNPIENTEAPGSDSECEDDGPEPITIGVAHFGADTEYGVGTSSPVLLDMLSESPVIEADDLGHINKLLGGTAAATGNVLSSAKQDTTNVDLDYY
jgi:hypothetical protein